MTHQQNKHFNSYKEGLDLEVLRRYCEEHGEEQQRLFDTDPSMAKMDVKKLKNLF